MPLSAGVMRYFWRFSFINGGFLTEASFLGLIVPFAAAVLSERYQAEEEMVQSYSCLSGNGVFDNGSRAGH